MKKEMCSSESIHWLLQNLCCQATNNNRGSEKSDMLIVIWWKEDLLSVHSDKVQSSKSMQKRYSRQPERKLAKKKPKHGRWMRNTQSDETCGRLELINFSIWLKMSTLCNLFRIFHRVQHRRTHLCVLFSVALEGLPEAALTSRYQSNRQRAGIGQKRMTQLSSRILLFSFSFSP